MTNEKLDIILDKLNKYERMPHGNRREKNGKQNTINFERYAQRRAGEKSGRTWNTSHAIHNDINCKRHEKTTKKLDCLILHSNLSKLLDNLSILCNNSILNQNKDRIMTKIHHELSERLFSLTTQLQALSFVANNMTESKDSKGASALIFTCIEKMAQEIDSLNELIEEL